MQFNTYWGDMHCNIHREHMHSLEKTFEAAREALDFFPIAYYPADFYETMEGLRVESVGPRATFERDWKRVLEFVRRYHTPGAFVTFPGYEWTGNRTPRATVTTTSSTSTRDHSTSPGTWRSSSLT
jgi:hypothetical protein